MNVGVGRLRRSAGDRICQARGMIAGSESVTVTQALVGLRRAQSSRRKPGFARPTSRLTTRLDNATGTGRAEAKRRRVSLAEDIAAYNRSIARIEPSVWSAWSIVYPNVSFGRRDCADTLLSLTLESVEHGSHPRVRNIMAAERKRRPRK